MWPFISCSQFSHSLEYSHIQHVYCKNRNKVDLILKIQILPDISFSLPEVQRKGRTQKSEDFTSSNFKEIYLWILPLWYCFNRNDTPCNMIDCIISWYIKILLQSQLCQFNLKRNDQALKLLFRFQFSLSIMTYHLLQLHNTVRTDN